MSAVSHNIDAVEFSDQYDHHLFHPVTREPFFLSTGEPQVVRLMHPEQPPIKRLSAKWRNENLRGAKLTDAIVDARNTELLVTATIDWQLEAGDGPLPHSDKAARALYTDPKKSWLRNQLLAALGDDMNYALMGESAAA